MTAQITYEEIMECACFEDSCDDGYATAAERSQKAKNTERKRCSLMGLSPGIKHVLIAIVFVNF